MESELTRVIKQMEKVLSDKRSFEYYINYIWDYEIDYDKDEIVLYKKYIEKLDKLENKVLYSGFTFITLSPDHLKRNIEYSDDNIQHLKDFCKAQFTEFNYSFAKWVVESGKNAEDPHLHVHAFVRIKNPKHHKRDLLCLWCKFFPKLIDSDYHTVKCNTEDMFKDKQNYMLNDRTGS